MPLSRHTAVSIATFLFLGGGLPVAEAAEPTVPALTVLVVVDQLGADFLERKSSSLSGGIARLLAEGISYRDARFGAVPTVTSCGHAALATGTYGSVHGIGGNDWFDRKLGKHVYCVEDSEHRVLGRAPLPGDGTSPAVLQVQTLADAFTAANPNSKVIAVAMKDRSAILLGGHRPTATVWLDRGRGRFNTSDYYAKTLPGWLAAENHLLAGHQANGFVWKRTAASEGLADDVDFEGTTRKLTRVFPHATRPGATPAEFGHALMIMPEADRAVLRVAQAAAQAEQLGADGAPDLLLVSLSANDYVLHAYGPDSAEAMESLASVDAGLDGFLRFLDKAVGRDRVVVALCADHGGGVAPEVSLAMGLGGGRLSPQRLEQVVEEALTARFGAKKEWLRAFTESGIYLLDDGAADFEQVKSEAARVIALEPGVAQVLRRGHPEEWLASAEGRAAARGYSRAHGGDLVVILSPHWIWTGDVAAHGSPYAYDTRVPLVIRAPGRKPKRVGRRVEPIDLPATLAALSEVPLPGTSEGQLLVEVLERDEPVRPREPPGPAAARAAGP
jgi:hypothetical protein